MTETWRERERRWQAETLRAAHGRAPEQQPRFSTISDLEIDRLYSPLDWQGEAAGGGGPTAVDHLGDPLRRGAAGPWAAFDPLRDIGFPGEPPFTRGVHPTGYRTRLWTMRMFAGFGAAEDTNERFHQLLKAGQTGLSIAYDMPTLYGYDTDDPEADGEFGTCGVAVCSLADMEVLLDGIPLDQVSTSMTINSPAAPIWAMYIAAAEKRGFPRAKLEGTLQNDILKEFIAQKEFLFPPEPSMRLVTDTIEFGTREMPRWNTISISGYHIREAGSTAVQELAFTIADGMAYVEEALRRGLRVDEFAPRLSFFFNSHSDFFEEIAKFRAARRIWWKLMTQRYRAENERSTWMRFHTQTAGVSLTAQQPLNNLTRVALQALAGVLGGSQSLHTDAYDEAWAVPSAEAALLALRQQQVIASESGVRNTVDPLGGSWFVESLTNEVERQVWRYLDEIDRLGGMVAATETGYPQKEIADAAYRFQREFDAGERKIVGVNAFVDPDEKLEIPLLEVSEASKQRHLERLARVRRERDAAALQQALSHLRDRASRPGSSEANVMPALLECANAYATLGEMCGVLRGVFGEYREPVAV
ncbi:methylmalonyl-CoA mutase family protein [soil metagenome]|nr:methylmalonyl-CoA mutase family protein [Chloroflexota bacterium]MBA3626942.1 methylmalonyl-CoA mutase family protein [Chloroflexota bacterium]MBA3958872.1 methylmalonyl-CoA mutase family protein [Chloroflexota bacterium]